MRSYHWIQALLLSLLFSQSGFMLTAQAATAEGGDAGSAEAADALVDVVFAIDTSGSMSDEAQGISNAVAGAIANLQCPPELGTIWARARFVGIRSVFSGTVFDERDYSVLSAVGAASTTNSSEDNGPVVTDFAQANAYWNSVVPRPSAGQRYAKAVVTIGDEGLDNGYPVDQLDYDAGKLANDTAIANSVYVFSIIGNPAYPGVPELFTALAEGGATLGGYVFNDTGGVAVATTSGVNFEDVLADIFCRAAAPAPPPPFAAPVPTVSAWGLLLLSGLIGGLATFRMWRQRRT